MRSVCSSCVVSRADCFVSAVLTSRDVTTAVLLELLRSIRSTSLGTEQAGMWESENPLLQPFCGPSGGRSIFWLPRGLRRERSEEHTSELQSREKLVCRLLLEQKKKEAALGA